jgi:hypothetical protein
MAHADDYRHLPSKEAKNDPVGFPSSQVEAESECLKESECLQDILPAEMPVLFREKLKKICEHCECKQNVLWNNFLRDEQHFDACFRYVNKENTLQQKCFLKCKLLNFGTRNRLMNSSIHATGSLSL